ncbi:MAG: YibE/F family protein, partial [Solirubrobacteraceae bacterium]
MTGRSSEDATLLQSLGQGRISLGGLVLAGILIAALGVLNDVTISQASTVLALRRANPKQRFAELYRAGAEVGRDHLGATVNTLVFAYAGASLPLLLIFSSQGIGFGDAV